MNRILTLVVVLLLASGSLLARRVQLEQAQGYARNWWLQKDGPRKAVLEPVAMEFSNIYLFVDTAGHGFVMLAADDRSLPVLGYSLSNDFVVDGMPEHVRSWVQEYDDQIQWLIDNNIEKSSEVNEQWKDLENETRTLKDVYPTAVDSLVTARWSQGNPYNQDCPSINGTKTVTGCVATATAQIMHYFKHPATGMGKHSYTPSKVGTVVSADFANTTYDWNNMPDKDPNNWNTTQKNAVAKLISDVGIAVEMNYGVSSSGAHDIATHFDKAASVNALRKYFKYKQSAMSVYIGDYSDMGWKDLLKAEIDYRRPVQYSGSGSGGHSFVCDGYDVDARFHFNWGWNGSYNGLFAIGALNPGGGGIGSSTTHTYNIQNAAVVGIEPDTSTNAQMAVVASSNNTQYGTVSGSGTYNRYAEVTLVPSPMSGCKFIKWSNGSTEVPLKFLAAGDDVNVVAMFEKVEGDTLYYCKNGCSASYRLGASGTMNTWGIILPSSCLTSGNYLTDVLLYANYAGRYYCYVYESYFSSTPVFVDSLDITELGQWTAFPLPSVRLLDVTKDLCVAFKSKDGYPCTVSSSSATKNGSYGHPESSSTTWYYYPDYDGYNNDYITWMIKAVTAPPHSITMDASKAHLTSASKDVDLRTFDGLCVSNKESTVTYELVSCTPEGIATVTNNQLTATGVGTVIVRAIAAPTDTRFPSAVATTTLQIDRGTLVFDNGNNDGKWTEPRNWAPHHSIVPDATNFNVRVDVECDVAEGAVAQCNDLAFGANGSLTVESGAVVNVKGELDNDDASKLIIKADADGGGSVLFDEGSPAATVEMYLKGTADGNGKNPDWQLRGSVVDDFALKNPGDWANIHVYEWMESNNANGCWTDKMVGSQISLQPWKGYGFANYSTSPVTVSYMGRLLKNDESWSLTRTGSGNANVGANLLTNSYSAPIEIPKLQFDDAQSSVIFYNTGSLHDWRYYQGNLNNSGTSPGQYLVCPAVTSQAAGMPTAIPAGQSFYVVAGQNGAGVSISYQDVLGEGSGPMYAPAEEEQFNVLGVRIAGENGGDRAVLIECENCSDDYDDGYDGIKYFGNAALPQLYVLNDFGNTSINAVESIVGKRLGVHASDKGKHLTMTFETEKLSGYSQLKLKDLKKGMYADILSGKEYQFTTTGDDDARFEVVGFAEDEQAPVEELTVAGNTLYVGKFAGRVSMYNMSGKIVWQADARENEWYELPQLLHGIYVIKTDNATIKFVK